MSSAHQPNVFSCAAHELRTVASLTEEAKLYHEAAQLVLSNPVNKDAGPQEKDLVKTHRTIEELLAAINEKREHSQTFRQEQTGMLWKSGKAVVDTLGRFEKAITSMAQASPYPYAYSGQKLIDKEAEITMLIWGPIQFLVIVRFLLRPAEKTSHLPFFIGCSRHF
jgi:hypothetical protein